LELPITNKEITYQRGLIHFNFLYNTKIVIFD
jgi:hypothetical protein